MKNIFKYMAGVLVAGFAMTACSPEEFSGTDGNIPQASDYAESFKITVNPETNYASFEFVSTPGITPVWIMDGPTYSSAYSFSKYYRKKGTYTVECKVKNANGISDGSIMKTFVVEKTKMNGFGGFAEDSDYNLFKGVTFTEPTFYYAPGWAQIDNPVWSYTKGAYNVTLPAATNERWQAQMMMNTGVTISAGKFYDFSIIMTSNVAHRGVKVKICQADTDTPILMDKDFSLEAGEPVCLWGANLEGVDMSNVKVVFDFGGNAANTEISIESFVLKDHANDDGTVIPDAPEPTWVAVDSENNIWNSATFTNSFYYADENWGARPNPEMTIDGRTYTLSFPLATALQWQNQVIFATDLTADAGTAYDFCVTLLANNAIKGVTLKLVQTDETDENGDPIKHDGNFFFAEQVDLEANVEKKFWVANKKAAEAMHAISLVTDFGGNPADTKVTIKNIILQKP